MRYRMINDELHRVDYVWSMPEIKVENKRQYKVESYHNIVNSNPKSGVIAKSSLLASVIPLGVMTANGIATQGVFWDIFMTYLFPWLTDIAKVFCAIKIAQAFYQEKRGGRDDSSGMSAFVTYGKWLLLFHLLPFFVQLIDEIGRDMLDKITTG